MLHQHGNLYQSCQVSDFDYFQHDNVMKTGKLILFFVLILAAVHCSSQQVQHFNSFLYRVNEGMLQSSIRDMAFDYENFCWISYPNGIQKFDGHSFKDVPVQPGLPDDKWVYFQELPSGDLLISHTKGISLYNVAANSFRLVIRWEYPVHAPLSFLGYLEETIYLLNDKNEILSFNKDYKPVGRKRLLLQDSIGTEIQFSMFPKIENHCIVGFYNKRLYKWDVRDLRLLNVSEYLGEDFNAYLGADNRGNAIYFRHFSEGIRLYRYNFSDKTSEFLFSFNRKPPLPMRSKIFSWHGRQLISIYDRVFELDSISFKPKYELTDFHNESFTNYGSINQIGTDRFGNLFLQSVNKGICKVIYNNLPIRYYGDYDQMNNYAITVLADKPANRILVGSTGVGLIIYDTAQQLIKQFSRFPGWPNPVIPNQIVKAPDGGYYVFSFTCPVIYYLSANLQSVQPVTLNVVGDEKNYSYPSYYATTLFRNNNIAIVQTQNNFFSINFSQKHIRVQTVPGDEIISGLYRSPYIIFYRGDSLIFLNASDFKQVKSAYFPNSGGVRCFLNGTDSCFFVGTNKGVFKVSNNGKIMAHWNKHSGIPDECIYSMEMDKQGGIWCGTNRGIFRLAPRESILNLTSDDGLQDNEFNTNASYAAEDGELFFAGINGVSAFYPSSVLKRNDSLHVIFTNVLINDVPVDDISSYSNRVLKLPYYKNALSFDFLAMSAGHPAQYVYQYRMIGFDKNWIPNTGMQSVRYFLSPGKYKFQVYASRSFNPNATALKEIDIIIKQQFWQTWWFILIVVLFLLSIAGYIFNLIFSNRYEKKMLRLQVDQKLQLERERISRDLHDSIGAYANTVLYKTQVLEQEKTEKKELLNDLKYASKDIITSLRETIWALKNESFTAQDCLIRIRNFVQALNRFYPKIHFSVEGDAPQNHIIHSTKSLNLVRIVQEAATNALKHSNCRRLIVKSNVDLQYWELIIEDDGIGFDVKKAKQNDEGNGLKHMANRASESGMLFQLSSQPGSGTTVLLRLPL